MSPLATDGLLRFIYRAVWRERWDENRIAGPARRGESGPQDVAGLPAQSVARGGMGVAIDPTATESLLN